MFADPQSITYNGSALSLAKIEQNGMKSIYRNAEGSLTLTISHQISNKRVRTVTRLDHRVIVADPLTAVNDYETASFYFVIDKPEVGFSSTQIGYLAEALKGFATSPNLLKLAGFES